MRMDPTSGTSAADLVNELDEDALVDLLTDNGEGRFARRIARAIVAARPLSGPRASWPTWSGPPSRPPPDAPVATRPAGSSRPSASPSTTSWASSRRPSTTPSSLLRPGGRCVAIAYHSGEDRLVKATFVRAATGDCRCPPGPAVRVRRRARVPTGAARSPPAFGRGGGPEPPGRGGPPAGPRTPALAGRGSFGAGPGGLMAPPASTAGTASHGTDLPAARSAAVAPTAAARCSNRPPGGAPPGGPSGPRRCGCRRSWSSAACSPW